MNQIYLIARKWYGMDLTEAEEIKKRWQEYTEEIYKTNKQTNKKPS